jgi:phospholipase/carboxylesterase
VADLAPDEARYLRAAFDAAHAARVFLDWMEQASERLAPERSVALAEQTEAAHGGPLRAGRAALDASPPPPELAPFAERFNEGFEHVERACELFTSFSTGPPHERIARILGAIHCLARAQETFYQLRLGLPPFAAYWCLPGIEVADQPARRGSAGAPATGILHVSRGGHHGGFSLYVPEQYTPERPWPTIVALHGGSGNGRDFLWTWVREAKSCGYLLVAPTAAGDTWSAVDDRGLLQVLAWVEQRYRLDVDRILLTGLSDGATFTLLYGLAHPDVYRALAPLCGVLHPANEVLGNLGRARGVPIYLVHGAQDFLFPVALAHVTRDTLASAGAALEYREIADLSHTYPRSENARILRWFDSLPWRARD